MTKKYEIRPDRGMLWWEQLTDDFFDLSFRKA